MAFIFEPNDNTLSSAFNNAYSMGVQQSMENKRNQILGLLEAIKNPTLNYYNDEQAQRGLVNQYLNVTGNQNMAQNIPMPQPQGVAQEGEQVQSETIDLFSKEEKQKVNHEDLRRNAWNDTYVKAGGLNYDEMMKRNPAIVDEELNSGKTQVSLNYKQMLKDNSVSSSQSAQQPAQQRKLGAIGNEAVMSSVAPIVPKEENSTAASFKKLGVTAKQVNDVTTKAKEAFSGAVKEAKSSGEPYFASQVRKITNDYKNRISSAGKLEDKLSLINEANTMLSGFFQSRGMVYKESFDAKDLLMAYSAKGQGTGSAYKPVNYTIGRKNPDGTISSPIQVTLDGRYDPYAQLESLAKTNPELAKVTGIDAKAMIDKIQITGSDDVKPEEKFESKFQKAGGIALTEKSDAPKILAAGGLPYFTDVPYGRDKYSYLDDKEVMKRYPGLTPDDRQRIFVETDSNGIGSDKYKSLDYLIRTVIGNRAFYQDGVVRKKSGSDLVKNGG